MPDSISVLTLQLGIFVFLAMICGALYAALRNESSLGWMIGALLISASLTVLLRILPVSRIEVAVAMVAMPSAIFAISQAVRVMTGSTRTHRRFWLAIAASTALLMVMLYAGVPYLYVASFIKLTLAVASLEIVMRLLSNSRKHLLDWPLMGILVAVALLFAGRIPLWLVQFEPSTSYAEFLRAPFENTMLLSSGLLMAIVVILLMARGLSQMIIELRMRTLRDEATGLLNREAFRDRVAASKARLGAVVFCDIDRFKEVNDTFGHAAGDEAIAAFAAIIRERFDLTGRMGGDEFALFVPGQTAIEARAKIETTRLEFAALKLDGMDADHPLTASFGIATYVRGESLGDALHRADQALYVAKQKGRNCTAIADGSPTGAALPGLRIVSG